MNRNLLPPANYAIAEWTDGRFYPLSIGTFSEEYPYIGYLRWEYQHIPPALGPWRPKGIISFRRRQDALQYCQQVAEEFSLLWHWQEQRVACELYPERNAWYKGEIEQQVNTVGTMSPLPSTVLIQPYGSFVAASIWIRLQDKPDLLRVEALSVDEAWEALYEEVEAYMLATQVKCSTGEDTRKGS